MSRLVLVRHAMPEVRPGVAAALWGIGESAREDCVLLAHHLRLPVGGAIFSSDERKATETADVLALRLGREVITDHGFREVDRPDDWDDDYRALVARYLAGEQISGWEPQASVVARFAAAVGRATEQSHNGDTVVVSHGQAISLYLASRTAIHVVSFWRALTLPDAWSLDLATGELSRLYETGLPPE